MKRLPLTLLVLTMIISCKQETKTEEKTTASTKKIEEVIPDRTNDFPKDIAAVFSAHGGIHKFDQMNSLVFEITNPEGTEKHLTDLKTRHARIETDKFALGFDGK